MKNEVDEDLVASLSSAPCTSSPYIIRPISRAGGYEHIERRIVSAETTWDTSLFPARVGAAG